MKQTIVIDCQKVRREELLNQIDFHLEEAYHHLDTVMMLRYEICEPSPGEIIVKLETPDS